MRELSLTMSKVRYFYRPGNVIFDSYWRMYDRVLEFHQNHDSHGYQVKVETVVKDSSGAWVASESPRWHCTDPREADRLIVDAGN